ncbi:MAG TPA: tRNA-dihydrouridine synthase [Kiritimatiellia bacterium]|jgi:tRNA-dihydrouridine synthase
MLNDPIQVASLTARNRVFLAPLAGVSDVPFRRLCNEFGAGLTFVEMLSSTAINYNSQRTLAMLARHESETVLGVQLSGPNPDDVSRAVAALDKHGFDLIDINMGCPVRKIVSSGWGCAYLKDPERVTATVERARAATSGPLTVKCRLGFTRETMNIDDIAARIVRAGADMLSIHGRFRTDDYAIGVRFDAVRSGFMAARAAEVGRGIPTAPNHGHSGGGVGHTALPVGSSGPVILVGNGDVMDLASARAMVERTGCDAVMVSRGALGNPWIFDEVLNERPATPTLGEWLDVVLRFIGYHEEFYGDNELSARRMRKHLIWFSSGFPRCNRLRERCNGVNSLADARAAVREYAREYPHELRRYVDGDLQDARIDPKYQMDRKLDRGAGEDGVVSTTNGH